MTARVVATLPDAPNVLWATAECFLVADEAKAARLPRPEAEALARQIRRMTRDGARVEVVADTDPESDEDADMALDPEEAP